MAQQPEQYLYDRRVLETRLKRGTLTEEQYQEYLDNLPDEADEADETKTRFSTPYYDRHYGPDAETDEEGDEDED